MSVTCTNCSQAFEVSSSDEQFYEEVGPTIAGQKFPIPIPDICPPCRMQRRIAHRNFFNLCHRTCELSGKRIISMYSEQAPFPVYEMHEWWSDKWDPLEYGQEPDLSRPVFSQLEELFSKVPRMSILNSQSENTDYCNFSFLSKNCYLIGGNVRNEDSCYGHIVWKSTDCYDNLYIYQCERCYECVDCFECYNLAYSRSCENCSDSRFLVHCTNCKDCFGCVGLKSKQYCMFNEQLTEDEYRQRLSEFRQGSHSMIAMAQKKVQELIGSEVVKHYHGVQCEDITGDYLYNCKNVFDSYDAKNCEDCRYLATAETFVHCHDGNYSPSNTEWSYQLVACDGNQLICCHNCLSSCADLYYCQDCFSCMNCFGCQSLKGQQYCILNKQYTKEEYETLIPKIVEHMRSTGEWGEPTPVELSTFAYNETIAQWYYPMTKEEVEAKGWHWLDDVDKKDQYMGPKVELLDALEDVTDDFVRQILTCDTTGKQYKIIPQELELYRQMQLPLPRQTFFQRNLDRMALRSPPQLWQRQCAKCREEIWTSYSPERSEAVCCEACYQQSLS